MYTNRGCEASESQTRLRTFLLSSRVCDLATLINCPQIKPRPIPRLMRQKNGHALPRPASVIYLWDMRNDCGRRGKCLFTFSSRSSAKMKDDKGVTPFSFQRKTLSRSPLLVIRFPAASPTGNAHPTNATPLSRIPLALLGRAHRLFFRRGHMALSRGRGGKGGAPRFYQPGGRVHIPAPGTDKNQPRAGGREHRSLT